MKCPNCGKSEDYDLRCLISWGTYVCSNCNIEFEQPDFILDRNGKLNKITKRKIEPGDWVSVEGL
jgi:hypothetical protein